jgi:hypothetical protein
VNIFGMCRLLLVGDCEHHGRWEVDGERFRQMLAYMFLKGRRSWTGLPKGQVGKPLESVKW